MFVELPTPREVSFARPSLLWLTVSLPILLLLQGGAVRRRRRALEAFAGSRMLSLLLPPPSRRRIWGTALIFAALLPLGIAAAGPRWGIATDDGINVGRDLVLVIDLSDSMLAEDLDVKQTRKQAALTAADELRAAAAERGGHRIGLVVFAAKPFVACPLTPDMDHVAEVLRDLNDSRPPLEVLPQEHEPIASGTRIGAALETAVNLHDPRFIGSRDILLLSDGDDPANDREWVRGVSAALSAGIPVHAVGFGDPSEDCTVIENGRPLDFTTRLYEGPLREIARATRGEYLPARRQPARLGEFFRTRIEPFPSRELDADALPQPRDRSGLFLVLGLALLIGGRLLAEGWPNWSWRRRDVPPAVAPAAEPAERRPAGVGR